MPSLGFRTRMHRGPETPSRAHSGSPDPARHRAPAPGAHAGRQNAIEQARVGAEMVQHADRHGAVASRQQVARGLRSQHGLAAIARQVPGR